MSASYAVANVNLLTQEQIGAISVHDLGGLLMIQKHANIPTFSSFLTS